MAGIEGMAGIETRRIAANGIEINAAIGGEGPPILLLHGFPHTWRVWSAVIPELVRTRRVIAPDLRGLGGTSRAHGGYSAGDVAEDARALLDALDVRSAEVVALDLGVAPAVLLALRHSARVSRLVVMEAVLGGLAGAEGFAKPWWFGFHHVPGLAELVVAGHEADYLDFFLRSGVHNGDGRDGRIPHDVRQAFTAAYTGEESLRCAFAHYRAMGESAAQISAEFAHRRLTTPVTVLEAQPVGDLLHRQLKPLTDDLIAYRLEDCGHIVPLDRPEALLRHLVPLRDSADAAQGQVDQERGQG